MKKSIFLGLLTLLLCYNPILLSAQVDAYPGTTWAYCFSNSSYYITFQANREYGTLQGHTKGNNDYQLVRDHEMDGWLSNGEFCVSIYPTYANANRENYLGSAIIAIKGSTLEWITQSDVGGYQTAADDIFPQRMYFNEYNQSHNSNRSSNNYSSSGTETRLPNISAVLYANYKLYNNGGNRNEYYHLDTLGGISYNNNDKSIRKTGSYVIVKRNNKKYVKITWINGHEEKMHLFYLDDGEAVLHKEGSNIYYREYR